MLSDEPWKLEELLRLASGIMISLATCFFALLLIGEFVPASRDGAREFYSFLINTVIFHGAALVLLTIFLRGHDSGWREFLGLGHSGLVLALALAAGAGMLIVPPALGLNKVAYDLLSAWHLGPEQQPAIRVLHSTVGAWQQAAFGVVVIAVAPVVEESLFRGILYTTLKQRGYFKSALFCTSVGFALFHANLMTLVPLTLFALIMVWLYERTRTLLAPITAHAVFNLLNFLLFLHEQPMLAK
jgi:membrane protease YdiL (CAAX protease family)